VPVTRATPRAIAHVRAITPLGESIPLDVSARSSIVTSLSHDSSVNKLARGEFVRS